MPAAAMPATDLESLLRDRKLDHTIVDRCSSQR